MTVGRVAFIVSANLLVAATPSRSQDQRTTGETRLPAPTGRYAVGRVAYHWIDSSRTEGFVAGVDARREMMVYVWYPARPVTQPKFAEYLPHVDAMRRVLGDSALRTEFGPALGAILSGATRSFSIDGARMDSQASPAPLLLFSHGFGESSLTYAAQLEDLASHGYVVAGIEHPFDAFAVWLPGDRVVPFAQASWDSSRTRPNGAVAYQLAQVPVRAADLRFVLTRIGEYAARSRSGAPFANRVDLERIGAFGHSLGGVAAASACRLDPRIRACINEDADDDGRPFDGGGAAATIKQPFLFFATGHSIYVSPRTPLPTEDALRGMKLTRTAYDSTSRLYQQNQDEALEHVRGGGYRIMAEARDFTHKTFMDVKVMQATSDSVERKQARYLALIRTYVRAFFDKTLRSVDGAVFEHSAVVDSLITIDRFPRSRAARVR